MLTHRVFFALESCPQGGATKHGTKVFDFYMLLFCFFNNYSYLCTRKPHKTDSIMTAIQLRAELFREMNPLLDSEAALEKLLAFVKSLSPAKKAKAEAGWADRFVGAWKDDRSADEIVNDIRSARTANTIDVEL
jgi:hypothetical protein